MDNFSTQQQCAQYLGISDATVSIQIRRGAFPRRGPDGTWSKADLDAYRMTAQKARKSRRQMAEEKSGEGIQSADTQTPVTNEEVFAAKARKLIADAARAEHESHIAAQKLARLRGESVARETLDGLLTEIASRQKQVLMSLRSELLPKLRLLHESKWQAEADAFTDRICGEMQRILEKWDPLRAEQEEGS